MRFGLLSALLLLYTLHGQAQSDSLPKKHTLVLPVFAKAKETGFAYGLAGLSTFTMGKYYSETKTSQVYGALVYTTQKQLFVGMMGKLFFPKNNYMLDGEVSYRNYPEKFWGLGNKTPDSALEIYRYEQYYLSGHLMKQIKKNFYLGFRAQMQDIAHIHYNHEGLFEQQNVKGRHPYKTIGIGGSITYDSRNDAFASTQGGFYQLQILGFSKLLSSDYQFNTLTLDLRRYCGIGKGKVVALQAYYQSNYGTHIPLRSLALFGGTNSIRGFYRGRYRGKEAYYMQSEYRVPIYKRFGAVAFGGIGDVANDVADYGIQSMKYSIGGGLRYAVNKSNRLNIRLDVAFAKDGNKGLYLDIGESF